ncbi:FtsX-like permease family protein [Demequina aestuarii]|uniref:FtsX-like permease family protein n=1 Tax=Demequina aestuarii TaxID=327095 RepID=UPI000784647C|nr:FtsX-like permease family protein [Demequina aestuarii]
MALLVALPAVVLMGVSVVSAGQEPTDAQRITQQLGSNEAWVQVVGPAGARVTQHTDDPYMMQVNDPGQGAQEAPGNVLAVEGAAQDREVSGLLPEQTRTLTLSQADVYLTFDAADAAGAFDAVVGPAWDPAFVGMYDVVRGSAPDDDQVMVSTELASRWGLDVGDVLSVGRGGGERTVSGVVSAPLRAEEGVVFGSLAALEPGLQDGASATGQTTYLPDLALDWNAVRDLNNDGVAVYSRSVAEDPPQEYLDASRALWPAAEGEGGAAIVGAGLGLLEVVLLAGAAFAVSMRRRQERLALLAATGAGRGALVGVGIWNGALLGFAGGLVGVPVGLAVGAGWLWVLDTWGDVNTQVWGLQVVWWHVVAIVAFTTAAGALAALVPAIASARRDVMAALRGSRKPSRPRRWPAAVGGMLVAGAAATLAYAAHLREVAWESAESEAYSADSLAEQVTLVGVVLLFAGLIALTPVALRLAARVLGSVSLGARLASRDAARHTGRTVPVVAAISVTVLIAGNVALNEVRMVEVYESDEYGQAQFGDAYVPLYTWQYVDGLDTPLVGDAGALTARAREPFPGIEAIAIDRVQDTYADAETVRVSIARRPDASLCPAWDPDTEMYEMGSMTKREMAADPRCAEQFGSEVYGLAVGGPAELEYILGRPANQAEREMLASGGAVVVDPLLVGPDAAAGSEGSVHLESWDAGGGAYLGEGEPSEAVDVPAIVAEPETWVSTYPVILSLEAAQSVDAEVVPGTLFLQREEGFTELEEDQLEAALMREGEFHAYVARPIDWSLGVITFGSLMATLLVAGAAAGLALGLARADARRDDVTLSSLGASPRLARSVAAWQGGILVGFAVGAGLACAAVLDVVRAMGSASPGVFAWDVLAIGLVMPPLIVAGFAWLMTRAPKAVHYRLAA